MNIKCSKRHIEIERELRRLDSNLQTRSDILRRAVESAERVEDWLKVVNELSSVHGDGVESFSPSWQAEYEDDARFDRVYEAVYNDLNNKGIIKKLNKQYFLLLIMMSLLMELRERNNKPQTTAAETDMSIPEMAAAFAELILKSRSQDNDALKQIKEILLNERNKAHEQE